MKSDIISNLNTLYKQELKGDIWTGIPLLIGSIISVVYLQHSAFISTVLLLESVFLELLKAFALLFVLLGVVLTREDVRDEIDAVIKYPRVSTEGQEQGTSLEDQRERLDEEEAELNVDETYIIGDEWESASTMLRERIDEIVSKVKGSDKTYCLMFRSVDRLSRADPLESCVFLWIMKRNGVILYFDDLGYFDLSSIMQVMVLIMRFIQSRQEYLHIIERGEDGRRKTKANNNWPADAPYGYTNNEDGDLERVEEEAEVIQRGVELVIRGDEEHNVPAENVSQALDRLEEEFEEEVVLSYTTILKVLRKEMYTGKLSHDGEKVGECPEIISPDEFEELQDILGERGYSKDDEELDHALKKVISKFGVDASLEMFEDIIKGKCPKCGGDVQTWGSEERMGHRVNTYRCVHHHKFGEDEVDEEDNNEETDEETCDFEGPLLTGRFLRSWESSVPITCPACRRLLDDNKWERSPTKLGAIEQTCENCGCGTTINLSADKFERAQEISEKLKFFESESDETATGQEEEDLKTNPDDDSDDDYHQIGDFAD